MGNVFSKLKNVNSKVYITNDCNPEIVARFDNIVKFNGDVVVTVSSEGTSFTVAKKDGSKSTKYNTKLNKKAPEKCHLLDS